MRAPARWSHSESSLATTAEYLGRAGWWDGSVIDTDDLDFDTGELKSFRACVDLFGLRRVREEERERMLGVVGAERPSMYEDL